MPWTEDFNEYVPGVSRVSAARENRVMRLAGRNFVSLSGMADLDQVSVGQPFVPGPFRLYELTAAVQWPDATRTGGSATEPDVPWSDDAEQVIYRAWNGSSGNVYVKGGSSKKADICFPICPRNSNGIGVGYTNFEVGDRIRCMWNPQSRRMESLEHIFGPRKIRWGKLDDVLNAGGSQTVSLWRDATTKLWDGWTEDSGDNVTAYATPDLPSGRSVALGKWVKVEKFGSRWVVVRWEPVVATVLTDYEYATGTNKFLKKQRENVALPFADAESDWLDVYTATTATMQTTSQVDGATQKLQKKQREVTVLETATESAWIDVHTGTVCPSP